MTPVSDLGDYYDGAIEYVPVRRRRTEPERRKMTEGQRLHDQVEELIRRLNARPTTSEETP